ncbi:hypothetical protein JANAI62_08070 [Jannaschia pagri]|uniref:Uncharacterized protein n=1 Tax=Jannaschia pagri TaxID=2829797 RepID=A0ABQ4NIZ6_9RHOB|nr:MULTISPECIES: hypothetical protein [unclassified Jannaschia]GIT89708.1 hypothetical protein JANAI61_01660 [Jannaschia sp. AI_61]GIT94184.1 hypothetical protein JANAI62_08070 [Jannaschia sp. AI_62]
MTETGHARLSVPAQSRLLFFLRSTFHQRPAGETLTLMQTIDRQRMETLFFGGRQMA